MQCKARLHQPQPRVELGIALRGIAHSAIDVSDGLLADLGHILERSQQGAEIYLEQILTRHVGLNPDLHDVLQHCVLAGGDDYELCFTAPVVNRSEIEKISSKLALPLTRIGKINAGTGCAVLAADGGQIKIEGTGYDHFA